MFFENDDFPWTQSLEEAFPVIRAELDALPKGDYTPWPGTDLNQGKWNTFPFFVPGHRYERNIDLCPETTKLIEAAIPKVTMASFSYMEPGAHIAPHSGFSHAVLRTHLALRVPEGETWLRVGHQTRGWEEGKVFVFDDMYEHEAKNATEEPRIVLMCDFLRPFSKRTSLLGHFRQQLIIRKHMKEQWKKFDDIGGVSEKRN
ncbi:MAG: aspartyl/asparaginyl beta-hydroxylase domain-containing protein [Planctomycetes bacterium]|nr:aspartyl/asparaginyl beta-hydroxylase domain-containing protein [Planctomycetota bacterium]